MSFYKLIVAMVFLLFMFIAGCSKATHQYQYSEGLKTSDYPRKIYVEDQVYTLNTQGKLPYDKQRYVEVRTKLGKVFSGKLMQIAEEDILLSEGYHYKSEEVNSPRIENEETIRKKDILILKIW